MIEVRITPIERYQVTYYSDETGSEQVATDLTSKQAENIAGAVHARAEAAGMNVAPVVKVEG